MLSLAMELIPGLPNELSIEVLLRLPAHFHPQAMETSSLWRIVLLSDRFYILRRLRTPFSSLLLLNRDGRYQILEFDVTYPSSVAPRLLASSQAGPLSRIPSPDLGFDCCVSLGITSLLLLNDSGRGGWMQFDLLSRQWMPFGVQAECPRHLKVIHMRFLGLLDSRIFLVALTAETPSREVAISYDYITHSWDMHPGWPKIMFSLDRMRLTFQGQIFIRSKMDPFIVYVFNSSTKSWKAHAQMTERLLLVPPWSRVVATVETLICVIQTSPGILEVMQQDVGQTKWSRRLEIATGGRIRVEFHLFIKDEHIFLVTQGPRDATHGTRCQEFLIGQRSLTCIFVPYYVLMGAVLMDG